jgi:hypothetical protein
MTDQERVDQVLEDARGTAYQDSNVRAEVEKIQDPEVKAKATAKLDQLDSATDKMKLRFNEPDSYGNIEEISSLSRMEFDEQAYEKLKGLDEDFGWFSKLKQNFLNSRQKADVLAGRQKGQASRAYKMSAGGKAATSYVTNRYKNTVDAQEKILAEQGLELRGMESNKSLSKFMAVESAKYKNENLRKARRKQAEKDAKKKGKELDFNSLTEEQIEAIDKELIKEQQKRLGLEEGQELHSGISDSDIAVYESEVKANGDWENLSISADKVRVHADEVRDLLRSSQLIDNKTYLALKEANPKWVPSKVEKTEGFGDIRVGSGASKSGLKKMGKGSLRGLSERIDTIDGIFQELNRASVNAQTNKATRAFIKGFVDNGVFDAKNIKVVKSVNPEQGSSVKDFATDDGKGIAFYTNGERYELVVENKDLYEAVLDVKNNMPPGWSKWAGPIMGTWRKLWTTQNPKFIASNAFRDIGYGYLRLDAMGVKGVSAAKWMGEVSKMKTTGRLLKQMGSGGEIEKTKDGILFKEMMESGGISVYSDWAKNVDKANNLEAMMKDIGNPKSNLDPRKHVNKVLEAIEGVADVVEVNTRFAAYRLAREQGMDVVDASHVSRELTIDFNKGGKLTPVLNSLYMFSNAGIQGLDSFTNTVAYSPQGRRIMAQTMAASALIAMMNEAIDDEGTELVKEHDKMKNIIIMNPFSDKSGDYFKIPVAQGPDVMFYWSSIAMDYAKGRVSSTEALSKASLKAFDFGLPVKGENWVSAVTPTVFEAPVSYYLNEGFGGREIYNEGFGRDKFDTPRYTKGRESTAKPYHVLSEFLNGLDGDSYTSGTIDIHPEFIPYFSKAYMGNYGGWLDKTMRYWGGVSNDDSGPIEQTAKFLGSGFFSDGMDRKKTLMNDISNSRYSGYTKKSTAEDIERSIEKAKTLLQNFELTPKEVKRINSEMKELYKQLGTMQKNVKETLKNKGLANLTAQDLSKKLN